MGPQTNSISIHKHLNAFETHVHPRVRLVASQEQSPAIAILQIPNPPQAYKERTWRTAQQQDVSTAKERAAPAPVPAYETLLLALLQRVTLSDWHLFQKICSCRTHDTIK